MESSTEERCPSGCPTHYTSYRISKRAFECLKCGEEWLPRLARHDGQEEIGSDIQGRG